MLLLKHNALSVEDLFTIERQLLRWLDNKESDIGLNFNVLSLGRVDIYGYLLGIFTQLGCLDTLQITPFELLDFLIDVDTAYLNAPYHSFYHAVDIVFVIYYMLTKLNANHYLSKLHIAALLIAGLCHDIGHPGYNNIYQVNFKTELAKKYSNESVLEAYSSDLTKSLLLEKHVTFVNTMSFEMKQQWIHQIEKLILQTDMLYHYTLQEQAGLLEEVLYQQCIEQTFINGYDTPNTTTQSTLKNNSNDTDYFNLLIPPSSTINHTSSQLAYPNVPSQWVVPNMTLSPSCFFNSSITTTTSPYSETTTQISSPNAIPTNNNNDMMIIQTSLDEDQCIQFLSILLHAADISNTVRPWNISKQWSDLIVQEFFRQGDCEKIAGLNVSPGMDRDLSTQPDISLTFGDLVVRPYFEVLTNLLPDAYIFLETLEKNRDEWLKIKAQQQPSSHPTTKLNNKRLSVIQYPYGHPYHDNNNNNSQQQQEWLQERQFPNSLLPIPESKNNHHSNERRVSVAAGTISIPDHLDLNGKSNLKVKGRCQSGLRSYSLVSDRVDIFRKPSYIPPTKSYRSSTLPVIHKRMSLHTPTSTLATSTITATTLNTHINANNNHPSSSSFIKFIRTHIHSIYILLYILLFITLYVLLQMSKE
ncbi:unnamed protein product [Cunninghamella echinulata]